MIHGSDKRFHMDQTNICFTTMEVEDRISMIFFYSKSNIGTQGEDGWP